MISDNGRYSIKEGGFYGSITVNNIRRDYGTRLNESIDKIRNGIDVNQHQPNEIYDALDRLEDIKTELDKCLVDLQVEFKVCMNIGKLT